MAYHQLLFAPIPAISAKNACRGVRENVVASKKRLKCLPWRTERNVPRSKGATEHNVRRKCYSEWKARQ